MGLIAGISSKENDASLRTLLESMSSIQNHRDDSSSVYHIVSQFGGVMANRQNNIFDKQISLELAGAMTIAGIVVLVDGVVLEVPKHMKYFRQKGYTLPVSSGSAVIAAAYKEWGIEFMKHLEGEFACAVWDDKNQTLFLSRDPYGHKPLHYSINQKRIIFSSEAKGILVADMPAEIDLISLSDYLSLNCIPNPATIYKNIRQVAPGETMVVCDNHVTSYTYWEPMMDEDASLTLNDAANHLSDTIRSAVRKRMLSEDVYCFLSGGVDSSMILSFAAELTSKQIHAVTVSFNEEESNELPDAIVMAQHVGAQHHHVTAKADLFFDMLETLIFHHDSPFTDTSAYPSYYAGKLGRRFTDIILTGDGPDQTMAGSSHHVFAAQNDIFTNRSGLARRVNSLCAHMGMTFGRNLEPSLRSKAIRHLYRKSLDPIHAAFELRSYFPNLIKEFLCNAEVWDIHNTQDPYRHPRAWFAQSKTKDPINQYLYADIIFYVPEDLMVKVDRMCMAHGLETLSPFQDRDLAAVVAALPSKYKLNISPQGKVTTKYILKQLAKQRFPASLLNKQKQGFAIPIDKWLRQDDGKFLKDILLDPRTLNRGYFNKKHMEKYVINFIGNKCDYFYASPHSIVSLLTLELWHRSYIDSTIKARQDIHR